MKIIEHNFSKEFDFVKVYPLSDMHIGDERFDSVLFHKFISHILAEPNRFIIYNGDNMNTATKDSKSNVYNECMPIREQKKFLIKELDCVKDRILVFVEGNHEYRTLKESDVSVVEDIACQLGRGDYYEQDEAFLKLTFGKKPDGKRRVYGIYCIHGFTGGKRPGASINSAENLCMSIDADVYVVGHTHKKAAYKNVVRRVDLYNNMIREEERLFVVSSHWSSFGGYAARGGFQPSAKGSVPIKLYARERLMEATV